MESSLIYLIQKWETIEKFTFGTGEAGHKREEYYVVWKFVAAELKKGITFKLLVSKKQKDIPDYAKENIL